MDGLRSVEIAWGRPRCRERDGSAALEEAPDERAWIVKRGNSLGGPWLGGSDAKMQSGWRGFFRTISYNFHCLEKFAGPRRGTEK